MFNYTNIYKVTKYLDSVFESRYKNGQEIVRKNRLELLVELGELANETRCFKYWSIKQTGEKEKVLEEYIDCLFMILFFCNITDVSLDEKFPDSQKGDIIETFLILYKCSANFDMVPNKEDVKMFLVELDYLAKLLGFTIEDLESVTQKKKKIIEDRFNMEY